MLDSVIKIRFNNFFSNVGWTVLYLIHSDWGMGMPNFNFEYKEI